MPCVQTEYRDRRVVHALRPTPIRQGIKSSTPRTETFRLLGVSDWVWWVAAGMAGASWLHLLTQGF